MIITARSPKSTNSSLSPLAPSNHESFSALFCRDSAMLFTLLGTHSELHQSGPTASSRVSLINERTSFSNACRMAYRRAISRASLRRFTPKGLSPSNNSFSSVCPRSAPTLIPAPRNSSASDSKRRPRKTKSRTLLRVSVNDMLPQSLEYRVVNLYILRRWKMNLDVVIKVNRPWCSIYFVCRLTRSGILVRIFVLFSLLLGCIAYRDIFTQ